MLKKVCGPLTVHIKQQVPSPLRGKGRMVGMARIAINRASVACIPKFD
jgi:hypothetical protein